MNRVWLKICQITEEIRKIIRIEEITWHDKIICVNYAPGQSAGIIIKFKGDEL